MSRHWDAYTDYFWGKEVLDWHLFQRSSTVDAKLTYRQRPIRIIKLWQVYLVLYDRIRSNEDVK